MNPLDRYRKNEEKSPATEQDSYRAFHSVSDTQSPYRIGVRCRADHPHRDPAYSYLMDVISDGEKGREVSLLFTHLIVKLRGKNLAELVQHLHAHKVDWMQEYDPGRWPNKPDGSAALIEQIEVYSPGDVPKPDKPAQKAV